MCSTSGSLESFSCPKKIADVRLSLGSSLYSIFWELKFLVVCFLLSLCAGGAIWSSQPNPSHEEVTLMSSILDQWQQRTVMVAKLCLLLLSHPLLFPIYSSTCTRLLLGNWHALWDESWSTWKFLLTRNGIT